MDSLPQELLFEIHVLSHSPYLPYATRYTYANLALSPPPSHVAQYLLSLYAPPHSSTRELLARCLRHPVCTLDVIYLVERYWDKRRQESNSWDWGQLELDEVPKQLFRDLDRKSRCAEERAKRQLEWERPSTASGISSRTTGSTSNPSTPSSSLTAVPSRPSPAVTLTKAIRKRKRASSSSDTSLETKPPVPLVPTLLPLLTHLFTRYAPSPSSHKGYPLCASMIAHPVSFPLTEFLLKHGADPGCNNGYAVRLAIGKKDLSLVKLLVERDPDGLGSHDGLNGGSGAGKKRKLGDRCTVDSGMLQVAVKHQARDICDYLIEKGVVPDLMTLLALNNFD